MDDPIDSGNFSMKVYLPLIRKDSITHMYGLAVYVKEEFPFARDLSLENSVDFYLLAVLLFWIYLFLLTLVFAVQLLSLHWEIQIMLLSQFPLTFHQTQNGMPCFIA